MRDYIIMTDSCCDLSQQEVEELELTVLPLSFTIEGKTLLNTAVHNVSVRLHRGGGPARKVPRGENFSH